MKSSREKVIYRSQPWPLPGPNMSQIHKYPQHIDSTLDIYFANQAAGYTKTPCFSSFKAEVCPLAYTPKVWFSRRILLLIGILFKRPARV